MTLYQISKNRFRKKSFMKRRELMQQPNNAPVCYLTWNANIHCRPLSRLIYDNINNRTFRFYLNLKFVLKLRRREIIARIIRSDCNLIKLGKDWLPKKKNIHIQTFSSFYLNLWSSSQSTLIYVESSDSALN